MRLDRWCVSWSGARALREDAELFAGLVHACRYRGLLEASLAAHEETRRLDPRLPTSVAYTLYLAGDYDRLARAGDSVLYVEPRALGLLAQGRRQEALELLGELQRAHLPPVLHMVARSMRLVLSEERPDLALLEETARHHADPEALYMLALFFATAGARDRAIEVLEQVVKGGFFVAAALSRDPLLAPVREEPRFAAILDRAEAGRTESLRAFEAGGGRELLSF